MNSIFVQKLNFNSVNNIQVGQRPNEVTVELKNKIADGASQLKQALLMFDISDNPDVDICVYDIACKDHIPEPRSTVNQEFTPEDEPKQYYNTEVMYECGIARAFKVGTNGIQETQNFTCGWDGNWTDFGELLPCHCKLHHTSKCKENKCLNITSQGLTVLDQ